MTATLPAHKADELLKHMRQCQACLAAKWARSQNFCQTGTILIHETLKERHG